MFRKHGILKKARDLSKKIAVIRKRKGESPLKGNEERILNIILRTHVKPRVIQNWLDSNSITACKTYCVVCARR